MESCYLQGKITPEVTIGIPIRNEVVHPEFIAFLLSIKTNRVLEWIMDGTLGIHRSRNNIVKRSSGKYILFIDCNVIPPVDVIDRLMKHEKDIVSALYFYTAKPHYPLMFKRVGRAFTPIIEYEDGLIEVDGVGMGCCLIKRELFNEIEEPWFDLPACTDLGEDLYFCIKAKEHGFKIFVDTTVKCKHIAEIAISEEHFKTMKRFMVFVNEGNRG